MMPPRGGADRAERWRTLARISHELFVADETGRLLDGPRQSSAAATRTVDEARLVRLVRRQWDKARRVPTDLAAERARAASARS